MCTVLGASPLFNIQWIVSSRLHPPILRSVRTSSFLESSAFHTGRPAPSSSTMSTPDEPASGTQKAMLASQRAKEEAKARGE